jgi:integrase
LPESEADFFYVTRINIQAVISDALRELRGNQLVIFCLATCAGMRRNEIDKLLWSNLDLEAGVVTVMPAPGGNLKTAKSAAKIKLEGRIVEVLREHAKICRGAYVLEAAAEPGIKTSYRSYRVNGDYSMLCDWLRTKGVTGDKPIHCLRKEFGSHFATRKGIFAASVALRHSTLSVTRKYYISAESTPSEFFLSEPPAAGATPENSLVELLKKAVMDGKIPGLTVTS